MQLPEFDTATLAAKRMQECQGTLIGGMVVALSAGLDAREYGYRMMTRQQVNWDKVRGDARRIAAIFAEHYQVTYGFGKELTCREEAGALILEMPGLTRAAAGQLAHWGARGEDFEALQRGFWQAMAELAGVQATLTFGDDLHRVRLVADPG